MPAPPVSRARSADSQRRAAGGNLARCQRDALASSKLVAEVFDAPYVVNGCAAALLAPVSRLLCVMSSDGVRARCVCVRWQVADGGSVPVWACSALAVRDCDDHVC